MVNIAKSVLPHLYRNEDEMAFFNTIIFNHVYSFRINHFDPISYRSHWQTDSYTGVEQRPASKPIVSHEASRAKRVRYFMSTL